MKGSGLMAELILAIICGLLAIGSLIYSILAWNYRGPILMNKYLLASDEETVLLRSQTKEEKQADYRFASKIFLGLFFMFTLITLGISINLIFCYLAIIVAIALVIFACIGLFRSSLY